MVQRWCFFLQFILFLFLAVLDLPCCSSFSLVAASGGDSLVAICGLLIAAASLIAEPRLWSTWASLVEVHGLSCPAACGIFLGQGLNPGLLPWQADSLPLSHYGSPILFFFFLNTSNPFTLVEKVLGTQVDCVQLSVCW